MIRQQEEMGNGILYFLRYKLLTYNLKIITIWQQCMAKCGILVSQPGIKLRPQAMKAWNSNH